MSFASKPQTARLWQIYQVFPLAAQEPMILRYFKEEKDAQEWLDRYSNGIFVRQQVDIEISKISRNEKTKALHVEDGHNLKFLKKPVKGTSRAVSKLGFGQQLDINRNSPGPQPMGVYL